jgi:hypothetical protein
MQARILNGALAALGAAVTGLFTTSVTILRVTAVPDGWGGASAPSPTAAGSFLGRLERLPVRGGDELIVAAQLQGKSAYVLYYPLSVTTLHHTDQLQIGGAVYEIRTLEDPPTDAVCRRALLWRPNP